MAKVRTPLLSFGASGKIGNTVVFFPWKGIDVAREFVVPSNPNTADQQTQRTLFTDAVAAYRNYLTDSELRAAWNRSASVGKKAQSGFNAAMSALTQITAGDADASFNVTMVEGAANICTFAMENMDDGAAGDEAGDFEIWTGAAPNSLLLFESVAIAAADVVTSDLGVAGQVVYIKLRKGGQDRSGIYKATLID